MTDCEWKGGCVGSATRLVGPWSVCPHHFRMSLEVLAAQDAESETVRAWVDRLLRGNPLLVKLPSPRKRPDPNQAQVYFAEREQLIKIGISSNVEKRMAEIGRGSSMPPGMTVGPVRLLGTVAGGRAREEQLHRQFQDARQWGEWFRIVPELRDLIEREAEY